MAARVPEVGTIITRTQYLLRCGVLKQRPLWLDVVETYPPFLPTKHNRKPVPGKPQLLLYKEDELRREVDRRFTLAERHTAGPGGESQEEPVLSLYEDTPHTTLTDQFVEAVATRLSSGEARDEAVLKAAADLSEREGVTVREREEPSSSSKDTALQKTVRSLEDCIRDFRV